MKKVSVKNILIPVLIVVNIAIVLFLILGLLGILVKTDFFTRNMERLTLSEQKEHKEEVLQTMDKIKQDTDILKESFDSLKGKKAINYQDKGDIYEKTDNLERDIRNLDIKHDSYITDISIDINPYKNQNIENFMDHSENLSVKAKRLVRYMEKFIYEKGLPGADQITLVERSFANVYWEIDTFGK